MSLDTVSGIYLPCEPPFTKILFNSFSVKLIMIVSPDVTFFPLYNESSKM